MSNPIGMLLPLLIAWPLIGLLPVKQIRRQIARPAVTFGAELALGFALAVVLFSSSKGSFTDTLPAWLDAGPGHAVQFTFKLTPGRLWAVLLVVLVAHIGRIARVDSSENELAAEAVRTSALFLLLLTDEWLSFTAAWFVLTLNLEQSPYHDADDDPRAETAARLRRGFRLLSALAVLIALGLLSAYLNVAGWSELDAWFLRQTNVDRQTQAILYLSGFCGLAGAILLAAPFPWQGTVIEQPARSTDWSQPLGLLAWTLPPAALLWKMQPVLAAFDNLRSPVSSLLLISILLCSAAALSQRTAAHAARSLFCGHLGIALLGLLQPVPVLQTAGAAQLVLSLVWFLSCESQPALAWIAALLLHSGCGAALILDTSEPVGTGQPLLLLIAWFALAFGAFRLLFANTRAPRSETAQEGSTGAGWALLPLLLLIPLLIPSEFLFRGKTPPGMLTPLPVSELGRHWEPLAASILAAAAAWLLIASRKTASASPDKNPSALRQMLQHHFSLNQLWQIALLMPLELCSTAAAAVEERTPPPSPETVPPEEPPIDSEEPLAWELARGGACAAALLILFLWWMG